MPCALVPWRELAALGQVALELPGGGQQEAEVRRRGFDGPGGELRMELHAHEVTMFCNESGEAS